jgi:AcrR family transcriptional regulator
VGPSEVVPIQKEAARSRILAAASELFLTEGIPGSGVDLLVERSGVAKATFYRHFPSKDDVVLAWLRGPDARWLDVVIDRLEREGKTPLGCLLSFWEAVDAWAKPRGYPGCPFLNTLIDLRDPDRPANLEVVSYIGEVEAYLARNASAAGVADPEGVGTQLRILAMGMFMAMRVARSSEPARLARTSALAVLAAGLATTPDHVERAAGDSSGHAHSPNP